MDSLDTVPFVLLAFVLVNALARFLPGARDRVDAEEEIARAIRQAKGDFSD